MQEQQLKAVAAATAAPTAAASSSRQTSSELGSAAAAACDVDAAAAIAVSVKVLTRPQPTVSDASGCQAPAASFRLCNCSAPWHVTTHQDYSLQLPLSATVSDVRQQLEQQHGVASWPGMKASERARVPACPRICV
jgi:hypothetical protein